MARREAELLLSWVMETDRGGVVARRPDALPAGRADRFESLLRRRETREPFQYLTGEQEFYGLEFGVDRRVLVPRPETEGVVEATLDLPLPGRARLADLGTGSGCIAVTLAVRRPRWTIVALDSSRDALEVARANAVRHGVDSRVEFVEGDLIGRGERRSDRVDAVVSNPPYVSEEEWQGLEPEVRDHEPKAALVPGPTGLEAYRTWAAPAFGMLSEGGFLVLELGHLSEAGAREAVEGAGFEVVEVRPDLRSVPRVLVARTPASRRNG